MMLRVALIPAESLAIAGRLALRHNNKDTTVRFHQLDFVLASSGGQDSGFGPQSEAQASARIGPLRPERDLAATIVTVGVGPSDASPIARHRCATRICP